MVRRQKYHLFEYYKYRANLYIFAANMCRVSLMDTELTARYDQMAKRADELADVCLTSELSQAEMQDFFDMETDLNEHVIRVNSTLPIWNYTIPDL